MSSGSISQTIVSQEAKLFFLDLPVFGEGIASFNCVECRILNVGGKAPVIIKINIILGPPDVGLDPSGHAVEGIQMNAQESIGVIVPRKMGSVCQAKIHVAGSSHHDV